MVRIEAPDVPPCGCGSPGRVDPASCYCSVEDLLRVIRRRYSLAVLHAILANEPARYGQIESAVTGASSSTLVETLYALEAACLVDRSGPHDSAPRTTYCLTAAGAKLIQKLRPLLDDVRGV
ncbi:hypothetical protein BH23GEM9_BH23GEM9_30220 [soil metagenome]